MIYVRYKTAGSHKINTNLMNKVRLTIIVDNRLTQKRLQTSRMSKWVKSLVNVYAYCLQKQTVNENTNRRVLP